MRIMERVTGDVAELRRRVAAEKNALRRDRYRAVLLALGGQEAAYIAVAIGRARRSVQDWAYAYRDGGIDAIQPRPRVGRRPRLGPDGQGRLRARLDAGPTLADGVATLRGRDVVRLLRAEFGVTYSLNGAYVLLQRLGYSSLSPRPRHRKNDPAAMEQFVKTDAPFLPASSRTDTPANASAGS